MDANANARRLLKGPKERVLSDAGGVADDRLAVLRSDRV
jgi:hypothetical protein